ncbi:hypothetical protein N4G58_11045 [Edwardsiella piscicida]|nr:hypothetical protein N4G58_11045 [Edwardsiella piscicida]
MTFLHARIYTSLLSTIPLTVLLALGMTLLIIAREIDLSFPSVVALGALSSPGCISIPAPLRWRWAVPWAAACCAGC